MRSQVRWWVAAMVVAGAGWAEPRTLWIEQVRVFDGTRVAERTNVLVDGGIIRAMGPRVRRPPGARAVDGRGRTLLPGLIDALGHGVGRVALEEAAVFGVTTSLEMYAGPAEVAASRKVGGGMATVVFAAGHPATVPGGHGSDPGVPAVGKPAAAQAWVDARLAEGSDFILMRHDGTDSEEPPPVPFDRESLRAVVTAAHRRGKLAVVRISYGTQAVEALEAGADGVITYGMIHWLGEGLESVAAKRRVFVVPSVSVLAGVCTNYDTDLATDERITAYLTAAERAVLRNRTGGAKMSCGEDGVRRLKAANATVLAGTDAAEAGGVQGPSMHAELELLVRCGLTPVEALKSATSATAVAVGLTDRGEIAVGKRADLVLVAGDPTVDIRQTRDIVAVWVGGQMVDRTKWKSRRGLGDAR
jgi:imidazolonepropionase-like amidohydrolase